MKQDWLARLGPRIKPALFPYWLVSRGMTLGVRCAAFDRNGALCLVRHTYAKGWHFPGGGVDPGETIFAANEKELHEEAGITLAEPASLFGFYANLRASRRDHVALFVARNWQQTPPDLPSREIAEIGFFDPSGLPHDVTPATRRRIDEIIRGLPPEPQW